MSINHEMIKPFSWNAFHQRGIANFYGATSYADVDVQMNSEVAKYSFRNSDPKSFDEKSFADINSYALFHQFFRSEQSVYQNKMF